jgi:hypothetical protein
MDNTQERQLNAWLDQYTVPDADEALLHAILSKAAQPKTTAHIDWFRNAGLVAATALCGFWFGSASLQTVVAATPLASLNIDNVILGPQTMNEVML